MVKAVEDVRQIVGMDARAIVGHADEQVAAGCFHFEFYDAPRRGKLDGIGEEIMDDFFKLVRVEQDVQVRGRPGNQKCISEFTVTVRTELGDEWLQKFTEVYGLCFYL